MSEFSTAYPNSTKTFIDGPQGVRVRVREIALEQGASSIRVYDTSGPQGHDVKSGLPTLREAWVRARLRSPETDASFGEARPSPDRQAKSSRLGCVTQLHYA